jgi:fucose permease
MLFIPVMTASYTGLAEPAIPDATMLTRLSQQMGAAVGTALAAVVLEAAATSTGDQAAAFGRAFWAAVALALVGAAVSLRLPARGPAEIEGSTPGADVHARS